MEALHDVVKAGKVRYLGASSMWAWRFAKMQDAAARTAGRRSSRCRTSTASIQREEEREMFGLLADQGVGSLPWSPLAAGLLARPVGRAEARPAGPPTRTPTRRDGRSISDSDKAIVDAVQRIAEERGVAMATVAMAWVLRNPVVDAPDHRRDQGPPPHRRGRRARPRAHRRRGHRAGGALHPARADLLLDGTPAVWRWRWNLYSAAYIRHHRRAGDWWDLGLSLLIALPGDAGRPCRRHGIGLGGPTARAQA